MKLTAVLLVACFLHVSAGSFSQSVTLKVKNAPLKDVLAAVKKQTGFSIFFNAELLADAKPVTLDVQNASLSEVLTASFSGQPLNFVIENKTVFISRSAAVPSVSNSNNASDLYPPGPIKIRVTDADGQPLSGATITSKKSKKMGVTDAEGVSTLVLDENDIVTISYVGYETQSVTIKNNTTYLNISLKQAVKEEDEITVAYNTTTRRLNTGSVSVVKGGDIQSLPARSIDRALQGLVPGLQITSGSGLPGANVSNITLRGIATGGIGVARNPLYVVDGIPVTQDNFNAYNTAAGYELTRNATQQTNPMAQINPNDIESISILKDAAAIALYGSRASNGVILITTKQGKVGALKVNLKHQTDLSGPILGKRDVLNQEQYLDLLYESYRNSNPTQWTDNAIFNDLKSKFPYRVDNGDTSFYSSPDWNDELYSNRAIAVSNDLSFSGGSDKATYYLGIGHLSQEGILKNTGFNRTSLRYNINVQPVSWFKVGLNSSFAYTYQKYDVVTNPEAITSPTGFGYYVSPLLPIKKENGDYYYYYPYGALNNRTPNPVASLEYNRNRADAYRGIGNIFAELKFLKHFSFRSNVGFDLMLSKNTNKIDKRVDGIVPTGKGTLYEVNEIRSILLVNNLLKYVQNFGNTHLFDVLVSQEAQISKSNPLSASGSDFRDGFSDDEIISALERTSFSVKSKSTFLSYFTQANYSYKQRYLASIGLRLDGSSRFGANAPLNKFWSFGMGWILSDESFLKNAKGWLNFLKLRGSVGVAGNTIAIPSTTRYSMVQGILFANSPATIPAAVLMTHGNPDIQSESTFNVDMGLEAKFWKDRVAITTDIYMRKTYDMVTSVQVPLTTGRASIFDNLGDMENKGIEFSLSIDLIKAKSFNWNITGNWSTNSNKLVKASNPESFASNFINKVGDNFNSWYLVRWAGVNPEDGSPQWFGVDGKITSVYNRTTDRILVGKPQPDGFGAVTSNFRYKNFELSAFFYYAYGFQVYNSWLENMLNDGKTAPYNNQSVLALDRWQKQGDIASNPKRVLNNPGRGNSQSTRYLVDGDYIQFKNLIFSYNLPLVIVSRLHMSGAKVFVQGSNLAIWTKGDAINPDNTGTFGDNAAAYPQQKSLSIGLNINF